MTLTLAMNWGNKFHPTPPIISINSKAATSAERFMRIIGILLIPIVTTLLTGVPVYAQETCSAKIAAILNDPEANMPPQYSGSWEAYECSSCKGVRVDLAEYNIDIEHKNGSITLARDLHNLTFGPVKLNGRKVSARDGVATLSIEFSDDGTKFKGTIHYTTRVPGTLNVFGKLSDEEAGAKRRQLSKKRRNISSRALTLALQCLKEFEGMNVVEKTARTNQLETELKAARAQLKTTQDDLKQAATLSNARTQILQVYAEGILKGGQRNQACTLFRALVMMDPGKADLIGRNGC